MKLKELIKQLQQMEEKYGDVEVGVYNSMDYWTYTNVSLEVKPMKAHPDNRYDFIKCDVDEEWIGKAQSKFNKNKTEEILTIRM